jgi:hypothetical protein
MNPFGCPDSVFAALSAFGTPMLRAVRVLGPERVQWIGTPVETRRADADSATCWALDGKRATQKDLYMAALDAARGNDARSFRFPEGATVADAKLCKARPDLVARDVVAGESWAFVEHERVGR